MVTVTSLVGRLERETVYSDTSSPSSVSSCIRHSTVTVVVLKTSSRVCLVPRCSATFFGSGFDTPWARAYSFCPVSLASTRT